MQTASTSGEATTSSQLPHTVGMPYSSAMRWPDSRLRLATLTSSTPSMAWKPGICFSLVLAPAPIRPTRKVSSVMGDSFLR